MVFPILVRRHLYIESRPRTQSTPLLTSTVVVFMAIWCKHLLPQSLWLCLNSLRPRNAHMLQSFGSPLVQVEACHLSGAKSVPESIPTCRLNVKGFISIKNFEEHSLTEVQQCGYLGNFARPIHWRKLPSCVHITLAKLYAAPGISSEKLLRTLHMAVVTGTMRSFQDTDVNIAALKCTTMTS